MQQMIKRPAATSFLKAVRCFHATADRISNLSPANCDRRLHRVTREEIATLFGNELGYHAHI